MATKLEQKQKELIDYSFGFVKYIPYVIDLMNEITELEKQTEEQKPVYDENYLNECIKKAKPNLLKIKDVDKELDEIRGVEPSKGAEATLNKYVFAKENMDFLAIITEWCTVHNVSFSGKETAVITSAMEQYRAEGLREELIKFLDFAEPIYWGENEYSDYRQIIDLYLKQKP